MRPKRTKLGKIKLASYSSRKKAGLGMAKVRTLRGVLRKNSTRRTRRASQYYQVDSRQPIKFKNFHPGYLRGLVVVIFLVIMAVGAGLFMQSRNQSGQVLGVEEEINLDLPEYYKDPVIIKRGENVLVITPLGGDAVIQSKSGEQYLYYDAYPWTDVTYTKYSSQIKEKMIFQKSGHPTKFSYTLGNLENYTVELDSEGNLVFYNKEKLERYNSHSLSRAFTLPRPYLEDSLGNSSYSAVTMLLEKNILTITLNEVWLEESYYPIVLDPSVR